MGNTETIYTLGITLPRNSSDFFGKELPEEFFFTPTWRSRLEDYLLENLPYSWVNVGINGVSKNCFYTFWGELSNGSVGFIPVENSISDAVETALLQFYNTELAPNFN